MIIGFDASRAQIAKRSGVENYTLNLLRELLKVDQNNFYRLYVQPQASSFFSSLESRASNFELRTISWPRLWTQAGLALECLLNPPDLLFVPAHTIPLIRRPGLKTVVTIHDVGFQEFLEQYQSRWWRLYGGRISNFAARTATHVIAVSQSTKRDLIEKLGVASEKITVVHEGVDHSRFAPNPKSHRSGGSPLADIPNPKPLNFWWGGVGLGGVCATCRPARFYDFGPVIGLGPAPKSVGLDFF